MEEYKKKLGQEPAFPKDSFQNQYQIGMSKRFYAACMAMQGIMANSNWAESMRITDDWDEYRERVASASFEVADELLKQEEL